MQKFQQERRAKWADMKVGEYNYRAFYEKVSRKGRDRAGGHRQNQLKDYIARQWPDEMFQETRAFYKKTAARTVRREGKRLSQVAFRQPEEVAWGDSL